MLGMSMADLNCARSSLLGRESDEMMISGRAPGKLAEDLAYVDRELERDEDSWEAWSARADILYGMGRYAESLECCDKSLDLNSKIPLSWATKGDVLCSIQRCNEAAECYRRAAELDPIYLIAWRRTPFGEPFQIR